MWPAAGDVNPFQLASGSEGDEAEAGRSADGYYTAMLPAGDQALCSYTNLAFLTKADSHNGVLSLCPVHCSTMWVMAAIAKLQQSPAAWVPAQTPSAD